MAAITSITVIESTPRGDSTNYVVFEFLVDNGDVFRDGPRFLPASENLSAFGSSLGARLLEAAASNEVQQWLSA